jgi:hypothetical protein
VALVGWLLVAGFVAFMSGAVRWRIEYEQPMERALPLMHGDRRRLRWIHWWMVAAMFLTVSGLGGVAWLVADAGATAAAIGYAMGAVLWVAALLFRLTVGEWAAEHTVNAGAVPEIYEPFARLAGLGHGVHMVSAYVSAVPLGWSMYGSGLIPAWLAVAGTAWGLAMSSAFLFPPTRFVAAPPFWAHTFTLSVGIALLL